MIIFRTNIIIDLLSVLPVFLVALMLIQAPMFKVDIHRNSLGDTAYSTGNTVRLTDDELEKQYKYTRYSFYGLIPFVFSFEIGVGLQTQTYTRRSLPSPQAHTLVPYLQQKKVLGASMQLKPLFFFIRSSEQIIQRNIKIIGELYKRFIICFSFQIFIS